MIFSDIFPLISAIFVFFLGFIVFVKNRKSRIHATFFLHALAITVWLFGTFMMFINRYNREAAIFWDRFVYIGVVFIPVFMYHFGLAFSKRKRNFLLILGYVLSFIFLLCVPTDYFVDDIFQYKWGVHTKAQILHHLFLGYFISYVVIWFFMAYKYYSGIISASAKQQAKYVFIGFLFLFTIGPIAYLPAYGIGIYPFAYISGLIFTAILAYAILKYRLMDIRLAIKRSTVFSGLVVMMTAAYVLAAFLLSQLIFGGAYTFKSQIIIGLIVSLLVAIVFRPFYGWLRQVTDNFLFKGAYQPEEVIADISSMLSKTLEINEIIKELEYKIKDALRVANVRVSVLGKKGIINKIVDFEKIIIYFNTYREPLVLEELKRKKSDGVGMLVDDVLVDKLESHNIALILPLSVSDKINGLLSLSAKKSGDMFTNEDIKMLEIISAQSAMALENALSYAEIKVFSKTLQQEVDRQTRELKQVNIELKKLDQAKSEFISIASHQLRTPVSVIKGISSMMLEGDINKLPEEKQKEFVESLYQKSNKLESIISDILNATEMTSSKYVVREKKAEPVDLCELLKNIAHDFEQVLAERQIKLKFNLPDNQTCQAFGQKEYLREAFSNLVDNAIKYTPSSSSKKAKRGDKSRSVVEVSVKKEKQNIIISIKDNGIGIPKEEIGNLFNKFTRASNARKLYTDGSGLGLFVVKEIIDGHYGKVWVESKLGQGTAFYVSLPVKIVSKVDIKKHILEE